MNINDVHVNGRNPRRMTKKRAEQLIKSIEDFPQMMELRPIVIDETGMILGGNMRFQVLRAAGYKEIPDNWITKRTDLNEEQKREFIIKDNGAFGEWDWDALANEWGDLPLNDWGIDISRFEIPDENKGIDEAEMSDTKNECPKCGFKW